MQFLPHQIFAPVSVVVPCYQCASTLLRAIQSVVGQTLLPKEVVLVDDASEDGTWQMLEELVERYPDWIKVHHLNINQGAAAARNVGWSLTNQPYIAFLDADDSWHPEKLRIQYQFMTKHAHIALSGHKYIWGRTSKLWPVGEIFEVTAVTATALMFKSYFPTPSVMLKRDLLLRFEPTKRHAEDANLWQQIALARFSVVCLNVPLAMLHKAPYGVEGLSSQLMAMERAEIMNFYSHYKSQKISFVMCAAAICVSIAKFCIRLIFVTIRKIAKALTKVVTVSG